MISRFKAYRRWRAFAAVVPAVLLWSTAVATGTVPPPTTTPSPGVPKKLTIVTEANGTKGSALCPAGTVATGGGGHASGMHGVGRPPLTKSEPEYKDVPGTGKIPVGWRIEVAGNKAADKIRTLVICEDAGVTAPPTAASPRHPEEARHRDRSHRDQGLRGVPGGHGRHRRRRPRQRCARRRTAPVDQERT